MIRTPLLLLFSAMVSILAPGPVAHAWESSVEPLSDLGIDVAVSGPLAEIELTQTFVNVTDHTVATAYVLPLERDAVVDSMSMRLDDRTIEGRVEPVQVAREQYEAAIAAGQTAALTESVRWNLFRQTVGNIPPRGRIEVTLRIIQPVSRVDGTYELTLPLVDGARFVPVDIPVEDALQQPRPLPEGLRAQVDLHVRAGMPVHDFTIRDHPAFVSPGPGGVGIDAHAANVPLNGDFVARWRTSADDPQIGALFDERHLMLVFEPPREAMYSTRTPRDVIVVLHRSSRIQNPDWERLIPVLQQGVRTLTPADRLRFVRVQPAGQAPALAGPGSVDANVAQNWVRNIASTTPRLAQDADLLAAVRTAWNAPETPGARRYIVLVSDGLQSEAAGAGPGHNEDVLDWLATAMEADDTPQLHTVGAGLAIDRFALEALASEGGGLYVDAGRRGLERNGASSTYRAFADAIDRPVMADIAVDWGDWGAEHVSPERIPDLHLGRATRVLVRTAYRDGGPLVVTGRIAGEPVEMRVQPTGIQRGRAIASTWARNRIDDLGRRQLREGIPAEEEGLPLALEYGILSPWTAFIAIDPRVRTVLAEPTQVVDTSSTDRSSVLTEEFLERIPSGKQYESAVQSVTGAFRNRDDSHQETARAVSGTTRQEVVYRRDGSNIVDPVTGTFSTNFDFADTPTLPPMLGRTVDVPSSPVLVPPLPGRLTTAIAPRLQAPRVDPDLRLAGFLGGVGDRAWGRGTASFVGTPGYQNAASLGASWTGRDVQGGRWVDVPLAARFTRNGSTRLDIALDARHQQLTGRTFDVVDPVRTAGSGSIHLGGSHGRGSIELATQRLGCADGAEFTCGTDSSGDAEPDGSIDRPTRSVAAVNGDIAVVPDPTALRLGIAAQATRFTGLASPVASTGPPTFSSYRLGLRASHAAEQVSLRTGALVQGDVLSRRPTALDDPAESASQLDLLPSASARIGLRVRYNLAIDVGGGRALDLYAPELALPERIDAWLRVLVDEAEAHGELKLGWDRRSGPLSVPVERLHTAPALDRFWQRDALLAHLSLRADLPDEGYLALDLRGQILLTPTDAGQLIDPVAPWTPGLLFAHRPFFAGVSSQGRIIDARIDTDLLFKAAVASPLGGQPAVDRWWTGWQGLAELGLVERFPLWRRDDRTFTLGVHGTWRKGRPGPVDLAHIDSWFEPTRLGTVGVFGRMGVEL